MIADLFHRMKYMERRGSGLRKIVSETEKLPGYSEIYNTRSLGFLYNRKSKQEICSFIGYRNLTYFTRKYLNPLLASGQLKMTIPDKPKQSETKIYYCSFRNNRVGDVTNRRPVTPPCVPFGTRRFQ